MTLLRTATTTSPSLTFKANPNSPALGLVCARVSVAVKGRTLRLRQIEDVTGLHPAQRPEKNALRRGIYLHIAPYTHQCSHWVAESDGISEESVRA